MLACHFFHVILNNLFLASSILCYNCTTSRPGIWGPPYNPDCGPLWDPVDVPLVECPELYDRCYHIKGTFHIENIFKQLYNIYIFYSKCGRT